MASIVASSKTLLAVPQAKGVAGLRPLPSGSRPFSGSNLLSSRNVAKVERSMPVVQAVGPVEVAQIAGEAGFIGGVAGVMVGITLIGLAFGFILLRVESLAEEGKI